MPRRRGCDDGSAVVEFCYLAVLLMVPLAYLVLAVFRVQSASYGVAAATREAGRAVVFPDGAGGSERSTVDPDSRALTAARIAMRDQGLDLAPEEVVLSCSATPCRTPGATVTVSIRRAVPLPLLPAVLGRQRPAIVVSATHLEVVDPYREADAPAAVSAASVP